MKTELTEQKIQKYLNNFFAFGSAKYVIDGLFVFQWESDKLFEMKSGIIYEFEIKISRSDFKNDFSHKQIKHIALCRKIGDMFKEQEHWNTLLERKRKIYPAITTEILKNIYHSRIPVRTPNFFYYAVPKGMIDVSEVPSYAGLVYVSEDGNLSVEKKAPQLHNDRYTDVELGLSEKFYYNMTKAKQDTCEWKKMYYDKCEELKREHEAIGSGLSYTDMEKRLKEAESKAELYKQTSRTYQNLYSKMCDYADFNVLERHLFIDKVKQHEPNFNYSEFTNLATEKYEEKYPNRKFK